MASPYSIAQETLGMSSMQRGIGGMNSPVRPGPNAYDLGGASKPSVNTQPYNNQRLAEQNTLQNIGSAAPQAAANAMGQQRSLTAQESHAQYFLAQRSAEAIAANLDLQGQSSAMMRLGAQNNIERNQLMHGVAVGKALAAGMSPDLGQEVAQKNMYG